MSLPIYPCRLLSLRRTQQCTPGLASTVKLRFSHAFTAIPARPLFSFAGLSSYRSPISRTTVSFSVTAKIRPICSRNSHFAPKLGEKGSPTVPFINVVRGRGLGLAKLKNFLQRRGVRANWYQPTNSSGPGGSWSNFSWRRARRYLNERNVLYGLIGVNVASEFHVVSFRIWQR